MQAAAQNRTAVFVFPSAAGHVNPSLPVCGALVRLGWDVQYVDITIIRTISTSCEITFQLPCQAGVCAHATTCTCDLQADGCTCHI